MPPYAKRRKLIELTEVNTTSWSRGHYLELSVWDERASIAAHFALSGRHAFYHPTIDPEILRYDYRGAILNKDLTPPSKSLKKFAKQKRKDSESSGVKLVKEAH
ncbi:hypothetical protein L484_005576 [Morus notabilis]|uniref:Uncharacterized protein n=1 Tax=Morus notabilis TaxID=981085 RepID=W9RMW6_9ROSA|nr:hypothetical protein L484_005576 [Morus notabilis]